MLYLLSFVITFIIIILFTSPPQCVASWLRRLASLKLVCSFDNTNDSNNNGNSNSSNHKHTNNDNHNNDSNNNINHIDTDIINII